MSDKEQVQDSVEKKELPSKLIDVDRLNVELIKTQRQLAVANAKTALAEQEKIELQYRIMVTNLFNKYGLGPQDRIDEEGNIVRGK